MLLNVFYHYDSVVPPVGLVSNTNDRYTDDTLWVIEDFHKLRPQMLNSKVVNPLKMIAHEVL